MSKIYVSGSLVGVSRKTNGLTCQKYMYVEVWWGYDLGYDVVDLLCG